MYLQIVSIAEQIRMSILSSYAGIRFENVHLLHILLVCM